MDLWDAASSLCDVVWDLLFDGNACGMKPAGRRGGSVELQEGVCWLDCRGGLHSCLQELAGNCSDILVPASPILPHAGSRQWYSTSRITLSLCKDIC